MTTKSTRRQPRRPSAPRPGAANTQSATRRPSVPSPSTAATAAPMDLPIHFGHVARDLRRILVIGTLMFALIFGARMLANTYGTNFVIEAIR